MLEENGITVRQIKFISNAGKNINKTNIFALHFTRPNQKSKNKTKVHV